MKYIFLIIFFQFSCSNGFAQNVTLVDSLTCTPIIYATVYDANGNMVGLSDKDGNIHLMKEHEYHISHIGYNTKEVTFNGGSAIRLSPVSYALSDVNITAKKKKYYRCEVFFRNVEHVDSCLKYYMDGVCEFFIDTKSKKVKRGNIKVYYFKSKREDLAEKSRTFFVGEPRPSLPFLERKSLFEETMKDKRKRIKSNIVYGDTIPIGRCEVSPDKKELLLSVDALYPKSSLVGNLFGYKQVLSQHNKTEIYRYSESETPEVFDLRSSNDFRHFTFTHKKEKRTKDIDIDEVFFVVERGYTDTNEFRSSELMQQDYKKYSELYPIDSKIKKQFDMEDDVDN